jgi:hypothetical protein
MFLNVSLIADWQAIACTCEHPVNENLQCANRKQCQFDYTPGQQVLKKLHDPTKLGVRTEGPYTYYCVKGLLSALTYAGFCRIVDHSTYPCEDNS